MTGYFEPILRASRVRHGIYQYPIYGVPDDLISVELDSIHPQLKGLRLRGKLQGRKLVPYDDRKGIVARKDLEKKHVICWADDPVEAFSCRFRDPVACSLITVRSFASATPIKTGTPTKV